MIELMNVTINTRHAVLKSVNFVFEAENIYGLVAVNGSGKTTLFRAMTRLIGLKEGSVRFFGQSFSKVKDKVFYYETSEWLDPNLSGLTYLKFIKKSWKSELSIDNLVSEWNMQEFINIPIKKYSLGMKQRLVIAMYLISDADCLIMDEITNGLDESMREKLFAVLRELVNAGKCIIMSSHYRDDIENICDVVLEIKDHNLSVVS